MENIFKWLKKQEDENPTIYELYNAEKKVAKDVEERFKRQ